MDRQQYLDSILDSKYQMTDGGRICTVRDLYTTFNEEVDLEALKEGGFIDLIAEMMEPVLGVPDPFGKEVLTWWAKRGIVKEMHGEDKPMDWAAYAEKTGYRWNAEKFNLKQNEHKLWVSYVPSSAFKPENKDRKYPVVVVLHGAGNNMSLLDGWGWVEEAARREWIAIVPSIELHDIIEEILEDAKKLYPVDASRIYVTGFSYGGWSSNRLGNQRPDIFAAVGPCGSAIDNSYAAGNSDDREPIPPFDGVPRALALNTYMPVINVAGSLDGKRFPFYDFKGRKFGLSQMETPEDLTEALNSWARVNHAKPIDPADVLALKGRDDVSEEEKHIGIPLEPDCRRTVVTGGVKNYIGDLKSEDGVVRTRIVCMWGLPHWPAPEMVRQVMEFFSHFSRDTETKESIYTP